MCFQLFTCVFCDRIRFEMKEEERLSGGGGVTEKGRPMLCPQFPSASSEKWTGKRREGCGCVCVCVCVEEGD